jgi:hypothetical protein
MKKINTQKTVIHRNTLYSKEKLGQIFINLGLIKSESILIEEEEEEDYNPNDLPDFLKNINS